MNKTYGPAITSCMKQNEKFHFEGLGKTFSEKTHIHSSDFQALARDVSIPWHQIYYTLYITEKYGKGNIYLLRWLILHVLYQSGSGHLRSDLTDFETSLDTWLYLEQEYFPGTDLEYSENCRKIDDIKKELLSSYLEIISENLELFGVPKSNTPFIYLHRRGIIYIRKYYKMEKQLLYSFDLFSKPRNVSGAEELSGKIKSIINELNQSRVFPLSEKTALITEKLLSRKLLILSGGPGTGKTTTVTALLRLLKIMEKRELISSFSRIRLAAPTGRAANRMIESINEEKKTNPLEEVDSLLPEKAFTLHKLLGINPVRKEVLYNRDRPIPAELVILDEASMVDARMMSLLFDALSPTATLLLVGDKDQLPSVDAGAVFGDIVTGAGSEKHKLFSSVVILEKSWRSSSDILDIAQAVINGEGEKALQFLKEGDKNTLYGIIPQPEKLVSLIMDKYNVKDFAGPGKRFYGIKDPEDVNLQLLENVFAAYENFAVLIPTRRGPYGVERINNAINQVLAGREQVIYHGQPILILINDYNLSLFNGDRGVIFNFGGENYALFREGPEKFRFIPAGKIKTYETAYAQTIHKSQGSEFKKVLVLIPEGSDRLLTREIIYTGITRAREKLALLSSDEIFIEAVSRKVVRHSGIREYLGEGNGK
jgi:exodeoxyribonuclease V alpha subunit